MSHFFTVLDRHQTILTRIRDIAMTLSSEFSDDSQKVAAIRAMMVGKTTIAYNDSLIGHMDFMRTQLEILDYDNGNKDKWLASFIKSSGIKDAITKDVMEGISEGLNYEVLALEIGSNLNMSEVVEGIDKEDLAAEVCKRMDTSDLRLQMSEALDVDEIAKCTARHINRKLIAEIIAEDITAEDVAYHISTADVASEISMSDLACEMEIDMEELAKYVDVEELAKEIDIDSLAKEIDKRLKGDKEVIGDEPSNMTAARKKEIVQDVIRLLSQRLNDIVA